MIAVEVHVPADIRPEEVDAGSPARRDARLHAYGVGHPIAQSFEPGEDWRWCIFDETYV